MQPLPACLEVILAEHLPSHPPPCHRLLAGGELKAMGCGPAGNYHEQIDFGEARLYGKDNSKKEIQSPLT